MQKNKYISATTEPLGSLEQMLSYEKELRGIVDFIHCDIMEKSFVGRDLFDYENLKIFCEKSKTKVELHLMCDFSTAPLKDYFFKKVEVIIIHLEAFSSEEEIINALNDIKKVGKKAGIALKKESNLKLVKSLLNNVDLILIMGVTIGKSGQKIDKNTFKRVKIIKKTLKKQKINVLIEVDGGINDKNAKKLFRAGADVLASGSYIYLSKNKVLAVEKLKK